MDSLLAEGIRVLVVDDDATCLKIIGRMLQCCKYEVTPCKEPNYALDLLRRQKDDFDLVLTDIRMPGMDGFELLDHIRHELDLPVIMMSADTHSETMMKGFANGACFYLTKPVKMELVSTIWQHVIRVNQAKMMEARMAEGGTQNKDAAGCESSTSNNANDPSKKRKEDGMMGNEVDEAVVENDEAAKKRRILWTTELHEKFIKAVNRIGIHRVVPKKILEIIDAPGLTRENVASHLQKYRLYLKRVEEANLYAAIGSKPPNRVPMKSIFATIPPQINPYSNNIQQSPFFSQLQSPYFNLQSTYPGTLSNMSRPMPTTMMTQWPTTIPLSPPIIGQQQQQQQGALNQQMMRNSSNDPLLTAMTAYTHDGVPITTYNQMRTDQEQTNIPNNIPPNGGMTMFNSNTTPDYGQQFPTMANVGFPGNAKTTKDQVPDGNVLGSNEGAPLPPLPELINNTISADGVGEFGGSDNFPSEIGATTMSTDQDQTGNDHEMMYTNNSNPNEEDQCFYEAIQGFIHSADIADLDTIFQMPQVDNSVNELEKEFMDGML